jgi:hypothetical protein
LSLAPARRQSTPKERLDRGPIREYMVPADHPFLLAINFFGQN